MTEELTAGRAQVIPAQDLQTALFTDFVQWIDRSQKTTQTYLNNLKQFAAWLRYAGIARPTRDDVISYRDWLLTEHRAIRLLPGSPAGWTYRTNAAGEPELITCKSTTAAQYMRSVCQFFRWTAAAGCYPDVAQNIHPPKVTRDSHRKEYLQPADVLAIEQNIERSADKKEAAAASSRKDREGRMERATEQGKRLYAMYTLAVNAGLRTVELSRANVRDFERKGGQAYIYIWGKGHTEADQRKPIAPQVADAITDYLDSRRDSKAGNTPLFISTGNRSGGRRIAPCTIGKMLKHALQDAGYDSGKLTAHSLRHSAAMAALSVTGSNLLETQRYLRHENPATTETYLHETAAQERRQADIAEQLYCLYHGQDSQQSTADRLQTLINRMAPQQIQQLTDIAAAMAG